MSTTDRKPGLARLQLGSRNALLEAELTRLLKSELVSIILTIGPANVLKWIELRRPLDDVLLARIVSIDEDRESLLGQHPEFVDALEHEGLNHLEPRGVVIPERGGEEIVRGVVRALESSLERRIDDRKEKHVPKKSAVWDLLERAAGSIDAPADWSVEHDHYLYGTPKRGDE